MFEGKLKVSEFNRHVLLVMAGTALSQALPVLASPILTRIFTSEQFGVFTLYYSTSNIFALLATLRYEMAIMLPEKKKEAFNLFGLALLIALATSIISIPIVFLLRYNLAEWFHEPAVIFYFLFIPLSVLFSGFYMSGYYWLLRHKKFRKVSIARFTQNFIWVGSSIFLGYYGWENGGLIYGLIAGQIISAILVMIWIFLEKEKEEKVLDRSLIKDLAIRYKNFPGINTAHALVDAVQLNGITYLLSVFYGNGVLGFYAIAFRTLRAPLAMIGSAMSQVLFQRFSEAHNTNKPMKPLVWNSVQTLFLIGILPFLLLFFTGPWLFKIAFGAEWEIAGRYAQILTPWLFFNFILSPISQLPNVLQRQSKYFLITLLSNICAFAALTLIALKQFEVDYALFAYSICMTIFTIILIRWKYNLSHFRDIKMLS